MYELVPLLIALAAVFMFAVQKCSRQMDALFGPRVREMMTTATSTPLRASVTGFLVTVVLQSSTAVSVLLVSLAEAGLLSVRSSLGVIIGTNVGSIVTSSLIAFQILDVAPYILVLGYLLLRFETQWKIYGKAVFYFGLLFTCLHIISLLTMQDTSTATMVQLVGMSTNIYMGILIGCIITIVLQSSSVLTGLCIILAMQGSIGLEQAFSLILGANIGTTSTALLASLAGSVHGRRVAVGHVIFNVAGVVLFVPIAHLFTSWVATLTYDVGMQVVIVNTLFNVISAVLCLCLFKYFEKSVHFFVREGR
jgi:phosphate:Na+ symporter